MPAMAAGMPAMGWVRSYPMAGRQSSGGAQGKAGRARGQGVSVPLEGCPAGLGEGMHRHCREGYLDLCDVVFLGSLNQGLQHPHLGGGADLG